MQEWSNTAGDATGIDHQNNRRLQQLRHGGIAVGTIDTEAVKQPLVTLDEPDISACHSAGKNLKIRILPLHKDIEIMAGTQRCSTQPQRINIVGALLEGLHDNPLMLTQRSAKTN